VLLYNAPTNTVVRSGRNTNRITGSGIANYREFIGRPVYTNPPCGQAAAQSTSSHRAGQSTSSRGRVLIGRTTPAGPMRRATSARYGNKLPARTTRGREAAKVRVLITRGEQSEAPS